MNWDGCFTPLRAVVRGLLCSRMEIASVKILSVVGARPNFMKVAPIIAAIRKLNNANAAGCNGSHPPCAVTHVLVHTGQHYDPAMSGSFFADLNLPAPDISLEAGSGSHAVQTAEIMRRFEPVLLREKPDVVLVVGDVNSTLACALVVAKASFEDGARPMIAHVEAGLRSFDWSMPEEVNRVLTDRLSDVLFVTEESGLLNLAQEGVPAEKIHFVGNTMIDSLLAYKDKAEQSTILADLGLRVGHNGRSSTMPYALLTLHRPANVDNRSGMLNILEGLQRLARDCSIVFPAHPRTRKRIAEFQFETYFSSASARQPGIHMVPPLGYLDFLCLMKNSKLVITDSGGIQEETTCLGVPCVTVRENTERPVTLTSGTNTLAGVGTAGIRDAIERQQRCPVSAVRPQMWDGQAAGRIVDVLRTVHSTLLANHHIAG
jgi:UDP-N-acetylglucosamine 2-epimerase (non-hydrolysing)